MLELLQQLHSSDGLRQLVANGGLIIVALIIFAETGLLAGFFLPGDSLLITVGLFTATNGIGGPGIFDLKLVCIVLTVCAILGNQLGYFLGTKSSHFLEHKKDGILFKKKYLIEAKEFYTKYGTWAVILARYVPIFRTFVPFTAGLAQMPYKKFLLVDIIGGVCWINSLILIGHYLGSTPMANKLDKIIVVVILVSVLPIAFTFIKKTLFKKQA